MPAITFKQGVRGGYENQDAGYSCSSRRPVGAGRCSTQTVVTLQNGTQYLTEDMPKTETEDGFYEFEDISGAKVKVRADEVATVRKED